MDEIQDETQEQEPEIQPEIKKTSKKKIKTPEELEIINQARRKNLQKGREKLKEIHNIARSVIQETKSKSIPEPIKEPITEPIPIPKTKPIPVPVEEEEALTEREIREYIRLKKIEDDKLKRVYLLKSQKEQEERFKRGYVSLFGGY